MALAGLVSWPSPARVVAYRSAVPPASGKAGPPCPGTSSVPGSGAAGPARLSSAPVDCPIRLATVTAQARRRRVPWLRGAVMVTSRRMPGPAVPGSCLTIACRSREVFVLTGEKLPPYLACVRQYEGADDDAGPSGPCPPGQVRLAGRRWPE